MVRRILDLEQRLAAAYAAATPAEDSDTTAQGRRLLQRGNALSRRASLQGIEGVMPRGGGDAQASAGLAADQEQEAAAFDQPLTESILLASGLGFAPGALSAEAKGIIAATGRGGAKADLAPAGTVVPLLRRRAALQAYFRPEALFNDVEQASGVAASGPTVSGFLDECERDPATGLYFLRTDVRLVELTELVGKGALTDALVAVPPPAADDILGTIYRAVLEGHPPSPEQMTADQLRCLERVAEWTSEAVPGAPDLPTVKAIRARQCFQQELDLLLARGFFGRKTERDGLLAYIDQPQGPSQVTAQIVTGAGGTGKSTLLAQLLRELRARDSAPLVAWLDFDRPGMDAEVAYLLSFELGRQVGIQVPSIAEPLHDLRQSLRHEQSTTQSFRQTSESAFERGHKAMHEINAELGSLLRTTPGAHSLVVILDTFEEVTRKGVAAVRSVWSWVENLKGALQQIALKVIVSGRLYDEQLEWIASVAAGANILDLPPLDREAAADLLVEQAVPRSLASTIADIIPRQPLPLLLVAQLQQTDPEFDLEAFVRDAEKLPERRRVEAFSSLVYWRNLARLRDPMVRVLAHPGLVLRRVTKPAVTEILLPALTSVIVQFEAAVVELEQALRANGLLAAREPGAPSAEAPAQRRFPMAMARLAQLPDDALASAREHAAVKPHLDRLQDLVGPTPGGLMREYEATPADAQALAQLHGERLNEAYAALVSYAWLVEKRPNGAWHRADLRRLILPHMMAHRPGVTRAIHEAAVLHYRKSPEPDDIAEAMYHGLMLADTSAACDQLERSLIRSAAGSIRRDADDLPEAANAFFCYLDGADIQPKSLHLLPPRERTEAFLTIGDKLARDERYEDLVPLLAARPSDAPFRAWEAQALFALMHWVELAREPLTSLDPSASPAQRHFRMHYKALAAFLIGELDDAASGFGEAARFAERMVTQNADLFRIARSVLCGLLVAHARGTAVDEADLGPKVGALLREPDKTNPPAEGGLGFGLEAVRLALLLSEGARADETQPVSFEFPVDLIPFDPHLLDVLQTTLGDVSGSDPLVDVYAFTTSQALERIIADARTMRELLHRIDAFRRQEDLLVGRRISVTWSGDNRQRLYALLRGPDPEFRDPLRTALGRAFPARADHEELARLVGTLYSAPLDDLQPDAFANAMRSDAKGALVTLVEFIDRARLTRALASRALQLRPEAAELARFVAGYELWCSAFDRAAGIPTQVPLPM